MIAPVLDATGLIVLRTADARTNIVERLHNSSEWGTQAQTGADHMLGQLIDPVSEQIGLAYELLQALYDARSPATAQGIHFDNVAAYLGLTRQPATSSLVQLRLRGTFNATIPYLPIRRARVSDGPKFIILEDVVLDTDLGGGVGQGLTWAESVDLGPIEAAISTITEIVDAHADWSEVYNGADAELGSVRETTAEFRLRRLADLGRAGRSTDRALRASLENIPGVEAAIVISNRTDATVDGLPSHRFEAILWPGSGLDEEAIATAIWQHTPSGIKSYGSESATLTDNQGEVQTVYWSYATPIDIYWVIDVTTTTDYPANGDDLVEAAVLAYGGTLHVGDNVLPVGVTDRIVPGEGDQIAGVPGVEHLVVKVKAGGVPGGGDTTPVTITTRQISDHDVSRITVNS